MALLIVMSQDLTSRADVKEYQERPYLAKCHATAYCQIGNTYTGKYTRNGIAASGRKEWIGKTIILYQRKTDGKVGKLIGIYEVEDTGCASSVIDVWCPNLVECQKFMDKVYEQGCSGKVYVQVLNAKG